MTELNTHETTDLGIYGNGSETIFVNKNGKAYVVQSPDLVNRKTDAIRVNNRLPVDMVALGDRDTQGLEIPDWVYEA